MVHLPAHLMPPLPLLGLAPPSEPVAFNVKWTLRKALAGLAALTALYMAASYRNYERDGYK